MYNRFRRNNCMCCNNNEVLEDVCDNIPDCNNNCCNISAYMVY